MLEEISLEQGRDENLILMREWIEAVRAHTPEELEGLPEASRTYAELRKDIYIRDNTLGVVEEPFI